MRQMRKLPIGIQTFEEIRKDNYLYVDKTAMIYQIANTGKPYFLSRPRRFGKSLLLSTFEAYFQGRKDLFEGLAIEKLETRWEQYPVLHLDLNAENMTQKKLWNRCFHAALAFGKNVGAVMWRKFLFPHVFPGLSDVLMNVQASRRSS